MTLASNQLIAGVPAIQLRDFLKSDNRRQRGFYLDAFRNSFNISETKAKEILNSLVEEGYLEARGGIYELSIKGNALSIASAKKRFKRAKGEEVLNDFLKRAAFINCSKNLFLYKITDVILFGSFLDELKDDYGDLDLIVLFEFNEKQPKEDIEEQHRLAGKLGWEFAEFNKARRFLKAKNPYISIHGDDDLEFIKNGKRLILESFVEQTDNAVEKGMLSVFKKQNDRADDSKREDKLIASKYRGYDLWQIKHIHSDTYECIAELTFKNIDFKQEVVNCSVDIKIAQNYANKYGKDALASAFSKACVRMPKELREDLVELMNDVIREDLK